MNFQIDKRVQLVGETWDMPEKNRKGFLFHKVQTPDELYHLNRRHNACWPRIYTRRVDYGVKWLLYFCFPKDVDMKESYIAFLPKLHVLA